MFVPLPYNCCSFNDCKYMKIIYMNCRLINEYESDLHSCEQSCAAVKVGPVVDLNP